MTHLDFKCNTMLAATIPTFIASIPIPIGIPSDTHVVDLTKAKPTTPTGQGQQCVDSQVHMLDEIQHKHLQEGQEEQEQQKELQVEELEHKGKHQEGHLGTHQGHREEQQQEEQQEEEEEEEEEEEQQQQEEEQQEDLQARSGQYVVVGPRLGDEWLREVVKCWTCLQPRVTQENRAYIPMRRQHVVSGKFQEEPSAPCKFGFFCTWQCSLAYCMVHFPHLAHLVHMAASANNFQGILAPTLSPQFVLPEFNPFVEDPFDGNHTDYTKAFRLVPDGVSSIYLRRVPACELDSQRMPESCSVFEALSRVYYVPPKKEAEARVAPTSVVVKPLPCVAKPRRRRSKNKLGNSSSNSSSNSTNASSSSSPNSSKATTSGLSDLTRKSARVGTFLAPCSSSSLASNSSLVVSNSANSSGLPSGLPSNSSASLSSSFLGGQPTPSTSSSYATNDSEQELPGLAGLLFDVAQLPHEPQPKRKRAPSRTPRQKRVPAKQEKPQETMEDATSSADIASFFRSCA